MAYQEHQDASKHLSVGCAVLTLSDTRDESTDASGALIKQLLLADGHRVLDYRILREDPSILDSAIKELSHRHEIDVVLTRGNTRLASRVVVLRSGEPSPSRLDLPSKPQPQPQPQPQAKPQPQPQAQPPENLVALDHWVRAGGRVVLLADPMLEWPSKRPLGDRLRPPIMFTDTGLLSHWGLRLDAPDERGQASMRLGDYSIISASPGQLFGTTCRISPDHLLAQCRIGNGRATVIADADFLNVDGLGAGASQNLEALLAQLKAIT